MSYICIMEITHRHCTGCDTTKEINEFTKDKYDPSGYTYRCKICRNKASVLWNLANPEKVKAVNDKNKEKRKLFYSSPKGIECSRRAHLKRTYNITLEQYNEKLLEQGNKCAICNSYETHDKHGVLAVDHDHSNGKIRGLLCYKCNTGLGVYNDNKELLINAIKYLEKYESNAIM